MADRRHLHMVTKGARAVRGRSIPTLEICAGAGGEALGLETAGFVHVALNEIDPYACATLRLNRPAWTVVESDVRTLDGGNFRGIGLLAGGVPCPPFSIAGKQLGQKDERDLFPEAIRLIEQARPEAVVLENVPGFASAKFDGYRAWLFDRVARLGYELDWRIINAAQFGVPQLRPRFIMVALRPRYWAAFRWPSPRRIETTVGHTLRDLMEARGWAGAPTWERRAGSIAPTIVGGSKKHGGPDLGPTRAKHQWQALGVDGKGIADTPPPPDFPELGTPRLTCRMVARLQGFPDLWQFAGGKTAMYRQIGNALPPPVAVAIGQAIRNALTGDTTTQEEIAAGALLAYGGTAGEI